MFLPVLLTTAALTIIMCVLIEKLYLSYTLHYDLDGNSEFGEIPVSCRF